VSRYLKSIIATAVAALTALQAAISDERVTNNEWIIVALAALGAAGVYLVPNSPPDGEPADPDMSEQGYSIIELAVGVLVLVILVLVIARLA